MLESERMTMTTITEAWRRLCFAVSPLFLYLSAVTLYAQFRPQVLEVSTLYDGRGDILRNTRVVVQDGKIGQIGTIAPGLQADIIGIAGTPLKDITAVRHVAFVMKGGVIYKLTPCG